MGSGGKFRSKAPGLDQRGYGVKSADFYGIGSVRVLMMSRARIDSSVLLEFSTQIPPATFYVKVRQWFALWIACSMRNLRLGNAKQK